MKEISNPNPISIQCVWILGNVVLHLYLYAHYPLSILSVFSATRPTLCPFCVHVFVVLCLRQRSPTILNAVVVGHTAISTKGTGKDWGVGCKERGNQWS